MIKLFLFTLAILIVGEFVTEVLSAAFDRDRSEVLAMIALAFAATALAVNVL